MAAAPNNESTLANATYWFEHELRQYPAADLDPDALKAYADRIVPMAGRESRDYPCYEVNVELGKKLGQDLTELPGGHIGFLTQPAGSHPRLFTLLRRQGTDEHRSLPRR
jgi:acetyltransferase/esterase